MEGEGLLKQIQKSAKALKKLPADIVSKRDKNKFPPNLKIFLDKNGDKMVETMEVTRTPLDAVLTKVLQTATLNQFNKAVASMGYDNMFHLALVLNNKHQLDKQAVVTMAHIRKTKNTEVMKIKMPKPVTFRELILNTLDEMGNSRFSTYDSAKNNCQDFVMGVLKGNKIPLTKEQTDFIKQDTVELFQKVPKYTSKLAKYVTDAGAIADKFMQGGGSEMQMVAHEPQETDHSLTGDGLKKMFKKAKKSVKKAIKKTTKKAIKMKDMLKKYHGKAVEMGVYGAIGDPLKMDDPKVWEKVAEDLGEVTESVLTQVAPNLGLDLVGGKRRLVALLKGDVDFAKYYYKVKEFIKDPDWKELGNYVGEKVYVVSKSVKYQGKLVASAGNYMVVIGTLTGQPELVSAGMVVTETGTAMVVAGEVGKRAGKSIGFLVEGDKKAAARAMSKAIKAAGTEFLDQYDMGTTQQIIDFLNATAEGDTDAANQALLIGAAKVAAQAIGGDDTNVDEGASAALKIEQSQVGSGVVRQKDGPKVDFRENQIEVKPMVNGYVPPSASGERLSVSYKEAIPKLHERSAGYKDPLKREPTTRGFSALYTKGKRASETGMDSVGKRRRSSYSLKAIPMPIVNDETSMKLQTMPKKFASALDEHDILASRGALRDTQTVRSRRMLKSAF